MLVVVAVPEEDGGRWALGGGYVCTGTANSPTAQRSAPGRAPNLEVDVVVVEAKERRDAEVDGVGVGAGRRRRGSWK